MPVNSYAPEFLELFKKAAREPVILKVGDKKKAIHLRFRFHNLRREMQREQHSLVSIANSVQFSITSDFNLKCYPADKDFLKYLREAGIEIQAPTISSAEPMDKPERADAEETVRKFLNKTTKGD